MSTRLTKRIKSIEGESMRTCKICKKKFEPKYNSAQPVCGYKCAIDYSNKQKQKKADNEAKEERQAERVRKEESKTLSQLMKEAQTYFNKFIRQRDDGKPCISCGKPLKGKFDAGHFYNANNHKAITFHEYNVSGQCVKCNRYYHGNLLEYRNGIINRYGIKTLEELESKAYETANYSRDDVRAIKEKYKKLCRLGK
jgi:hypothetical protein